MFDIPISFIVICVIFSAWCALHDHLNGTFTPTVRKVNFVIEMLLLIYTIYSFGIIKAIVIGIAFGIVGGLFGILWDILGLRKI